MLIDDLCMRSWDLLHLLLFLLLYLFLLHFIFLIVVEVYFWLFTVFFCQNYLSTRAVDNGDADQSVHEFKILRLDTTETIELEMGQSREIQDKIFHVYHFILIIIGV